MQDPDAERVLREFEKQRLQFAHTALARAPMPLIVGLLHVAFKEANREHWQWQYEPRVVAWGILFGSAIVPLVILAALAVAVDARPSILTPRFLDRCDVLLSALWVWTGTVRALNAWYSADILVCACFRALYAIAVGNLRQTAVTNTLVFAVNALNLRSREGMWPSWFLLEVCLTVAIYAVCWVWREYQLGRAREAVRVQKTSHGAVLLEQMMEVICDAVPRLDTDLQLLEPCQRLSSLLLRDGSIAQGARFTDLVVHEDLDRVLACLRGPLEQPGCATRGRAPPCGQGPADRATSFAGLCRARLRTANSRQLPVLVYYSCVPNLDGRPEFLLGVCEDSQEDPYEPRVVVEPDVRLATLPEQHVAIEDDARSNGSWSAASSEGEEGAEQHTVVVDLGSGNLRVVSSSLSFDLLGGTKGACEGLADWMGASDVNKIREVCGHHSGGEVAVLLKPQVGGGSYACQVARAPGGSSDLTAEPEALATASGSVCLTLRTTEFSPMRKKTAGKMLQSLIKSLYSNAGPLTSTMADEAADRNQRRDLHEVELVDAVLRVRFVDGYKPLITKARCGDPELKERFEELPKLYGWFEDRSGFICAIGEALAKLDRTTGKWAGTKALGTFAFRQPNRGEGEPRAAAQVLLLDASWKPVLKATLGFRLVELPPSPATGAQPTEHGSGRAGQPLRAAAEPSSNLSL